MPSRTILLTAIAMLAFAGNSLLCRMALKLTGVDAASFAAVRLVSGALALLLLLCWRARTSAGRSSGIRARVMTPVMAYGNWGSTLALSAYAALFSFAYVGMTAATGALLLFGAVQTSMIVLVLRKPSA